MPPVAVSTPCATCMPWMSSGTVSLRTSSTSRPSAAQRTASSAVKTTSPHAAPGEAGSPVVTAGSAAQASGSKTGASNWVSASGSTMRTASSGSITPSATRSVAITTAAYPVRFPLRVCSM